VILFFAGLTILNGLLGHMPWMALVGAALFMCFHLLLGRRPSTGAAAGTVLAIGFGLVHGLAFSSVLAESLAGSSNLVSSLFGFNVGVELGQLAVIALGLVAFRVMQVATGRSVATVSLVSTWACAGILAAGVFWTFSRLIGG
jgi:hypothetical protein